MGTSPLTDCGAISAALTAEHQAIDVALETLAEAMHAGASVEVLNKIMSMVLRFCEEHFAREERCFRARGYFDIELHVSAHEDLLRSFRAVQIAISTNQLEATLDASDLLNTFHNHVDGLDRLAHAQFEEDQPVRFGHLPNRVD